MSIIVKDPNLVNTPPGWAVCDEALSKYTPPSAMGFVCSAGDLNRFWSRYRVAKSFRHIVLDSYTAETVAGYSALFQVFLAYSAFEQFMDCCGLNLSGMEPLLPPYNPAECEAAIRHIEKYAEFLAVVLEHLDREGHRTQLQAFLAAEPSNVLYVAAGIRHIFAHGKLTPNSGAGFTAPAQEVSRVLSEFLFRVMDGEFAGRLRAHGYKV